MTYRGVAAGVLICLAVAGLFVVGVEAVGAEHDDSVGSSDVVEIQSVTTEGADPGMLEVEITYYLGGDVSGLEVEFNGEIDEILELEGFEESGGTYKWDERTSEPTIRLTRNADVQNMQFGGLDYTATEEWALIGQTDTTLTAFAREPDSLDFTTHVESPEPGVNGQTIAYVGEYENERVEGSNENIQAVVSNETEAEISPEAVGETLVETSEMFDVGAESDELTAFVVGDPLRRGGLAPDSGTDFWAHEASVEVGTTLWHEYVHTRQNYDRHPSSEWTHEAEADYFAYLLALKQGERSYHRFHRLLAGYDEQYGNVVLADRDSWRGTTANYDLGALVLANLDTEIRDASNGQSTYEDVLATKNDHGEEIADDDFEQFVTEVANEDLSEFFEEHVRSEPGSLSVPPPTAYDADNIRAALRMDLPDIPDDRELALVPGEQRTVTLDLSNRGTETGLAPLVTVSTPDGVEVSGLSVAESAGEITRIEEGWVLSHLEPEESLEVDLTLVAATDSELDTASVEAAVEDMTGNEAAVSTPVTTATRPTLTVDAPEFATVGEEVQLSAAVSADTDTTVEWSTEEFVRIGDQVNVTFRESGFHEVTVTAETERGLTSSTTIEVAVSEEAESPVDELGPGFGVATTLVGLFTLLTLTRARRRQS